MYNVHFKQEQLMARRNQKWTNSLWYLKKKVVGVSGGVHLDKNCGTKKQ